MALPTPEYNLKPFPNVYMPSEDTFLFLDALEEELGFLSLLDPTCVLEVGPGSGVVITALATHFKGKCAFFASDINLEACRATVETASLNNANIQVCNMNLFLNFKRNLFDVILFNPPYVVTEEDELDGVGLNRAWAGGTMGRQIIDVFLEQFSRYLSDKGVCYMIALKENDVEGIGETVRKSGFNMEIVKQRKVPGEHLYVLKFKKS